MKKKKKPLKALVIILIIAVLIGGTAGGIAIYANRINDKTEPETELSSWMSYISGDVLLKNVVIPGAHDAGTAGMAYVSETQSRPVKDLLKCGVRYLDLRVSEKKGKLRIYHGPIFGADFSEVLADIKAFINNNATETLILDFQHFGNEAKDKTLSLVETELGELMVECVGDEVSFIDGLKLSVCRGKILVYVGEDDGTQTDKSYFFKRGTDEEVPQDCSIQSLYYAKLHKSNVKKFMREALTSYIGTYKERNSGLFVLQCQLTDGLLVFGPKFRESQLEKTMNEYVRSLAESEDLPYINVIMRDYLSPKKSEDIIFLNLAKGNVIQNGKEEFEKIFG